MNNRKKLKYDCILVFNFRLHTLHVTCTFVKCNVDENKPSCCQLMFNRLLWVHTDSPRFPGLPAPPVGPAGPGAPASPRAPGDPGSPRSP